MDTDSHGFYRRKTEETERRKMLQFLGPATFIEAFDHGSKLTSP